jgi:hypothetical protein
MFLVPLSLKRAAPLEGTIRGRRVRYPSNDGLAARAAKPNSQPQATSPPHVVGPFVGFGAPDDDRSIRVRVAPDDLAIAGNAQGMLGIKFRYSFSGPPFDEKLKVEFTVYSKAPVKVISAGIL